MHRFAVKQRLPIDLDKAWSFFSDPANLSLITPDSMNFTIRFGADRNMYAGQIIAYRVNPFPGIRSNWVTEITHVKDRQFFVDEQRFGPYRFWHHKHFFHAIPGGVEMEDIVDYQLPFSFIGRMMEPWLVRPKLRNIFSYREQKLHELFGVYIDKDHI